MQLDKLRDENPSQCPQTILWGTFLREPSYKISNCIEEVGLEKQTAYKDNLTLDLFWQLSLELHNLKNSSKDGSNPLSDHKLYTFVPFW